MANTTKITFGSVFGNYIWKGVAEVTPEIALLLAPLGALQIAQRSPSTVAEKAMAGYGDKRPKGFKRTDIPFSEKGAEILKSNLSVLSIPVGDDKVIELMVDAEVSLYEGSDESKYTQERKHYHKRFMESKLPELAKNVKYAGELGDGSEKNAPMEFLVAIRQEKIRRANEM